MRSSPSSPLRTHTLTPLPPRGTQIVPGLQNNVAVELIVTHIRRQLAERSLSFRSNLPAPSSLPPPTSAAAQKQAGNVVLLEQTTGLLGLLTILRDRETAREDFVHYCDRLATMCVLPSPSPPSPALVARR